MKVVSATAASPIRYETSRGTDRISVLLRCDTQTPAEAPDLEPASPDHTKHIGPEALRYRQENRSPSYQHQCGEGPRRPSQDVFAPAGFSGSPQSAHRPLSRSQAHSAQSRYALYVTPLHQECDESFGPKPRKISQLQRTGRARTALWLCLLRPISTRRSENGSPKRRRPR